MAVVVARVTARVKSDHIVDVVDAGVDPESGMPFLVMEPCMTTSWES